MYHSNNFFLMIFQQVNRIVLMDGHMWDQLSVLKCVFFLLKRQISESFRHHAKACAPQNVQVTCHPDRMELTFPATAVGGSQEQVKHKKICH